MRFSLLSQVLWLFISILCIPSVAEAAPRVALLLEGTIGVIEDHGYGDSLRQGMERAKKDFGITYDVIISSTPEALEADFHKAAKAGYDLILAPTPPTHELLMNNAGNYRKVRFVAIDESIKAPNITSVVFSDVQSSFLCGFAAGLYTIKTSAPIIGWIGSFDTPSQRAMLDAYIQGARLADPQIRVLTAFTESLEDIDAGKKAALNMYGQQANIIMHVAGKSGLGVIAAAQEQKSWAIGSVQDQKNLAPNHIFLSQTKAVNEAVYDAIKSIVQNTFKGEEVKQMTLENNGVGITPLNPALPKGIADEISARLQELSYEIKRGSIKLAPPRKAGLCDCL